MQTRRDQLQAYRFQNRRALAALVTGEPNVLEAPMRRLTVTTISGIMIAILVAAVFAVIGFFKPDPGKSWQDPGAIIVVRDSPTIYVLGTVNGKMVLHPSVNYASAVLAVGAKATPHVVYVDAGDLGNTPIGSTVGINYLPTTFPSAGDLIRSPFAVCSSERAGESNNLVAHVSVSIGSQASSRSLGSDQAVLVASVKSKTDGYLLTGGKSYRIDLNAGPAVFLGLQNAKPLQVGTAFLDSIPAGPELKAPDLANAGDAVTGYSVPGADAHVGDILQVEGGQGQLVVLPDGVATVTKVQSDLIQAVNTPSGPVKTFSISRTVEASLLTDHASNGPRGTLLAQFGDLPDTVPQLTTGPADKGGLCSVYANGSLTPSLATPPTQLPPYPNSSVTESVQSAQGKADEVDIKPGGAALVRFSAAQTEVYLIAGPGEKYAAPSPAALKGFGYAGVDPVQLPVQLETLIPNGAAFDADAAVKPPVN